MLLILLQDSYPNRYLWINDPVDVGEVHGDLKSESDFFSCPVENWRKNPPTFSRKVGIITNSYIIKDKYNENNAGMGEKSH